MPGRPSRGQRVVDAPPLESPGSGSPRGFCFWLFWKGLGAWEGIWEQICAVERGL